MFHTEEVIRRQRGCGPPIVTRGNNGKRTGKYVAFATSQADSSALLVFLHWQEEVVSLALNLQWWDSHVWPRDISAHKQADGDVPPAPAVALSQQLFLLAELRHPLTGEDWSILLSVALAHLQKLGLTMTLSLPWGDRYWAPDNEGEPLEVRMDAPWPAIAFVPCSWVPAPWTVCQRFCNPCQQE